MALNPKQEAFVREYLIDLNATQAAIRAGYSQKTAKQIGARLLTHVDVQAAIQEQQKQRFTRLQLDADDLLARAATVLTADPRELTSHRIGSCRFCWGQDHEYQWKTPREYREARADAESKLPKEATQEQRDLLPNEIGGYGYRLPLPPNPDCPECAGLGIPFTLFADTSTLSPAAAILFEGVKETRNGIEFQMADKAKAFDTLAKHKGLLKERVEHDVTDGLAELLKGAQGTPFPLGARPPKVGDE